MDSTFDKEAIGEIGQLIRIFQNIAPISNDEIISAVSEFRKISADKQLIVDFIQFVFESDASP